jgi:membrane fusion protein (multidrug efflux system)
VADPVKVPPVLNDDEAEEIRGPQPVEARQNGPVSFFRAHPHARWILAVVAVLVIVGVVFVWHYYSVRESTDDAQIDGHIDPISPRVPGTVLRVLHDDNQSVAPGELLVELDPKDYEVAVQHAQADLADALANSSAARVGIPITTTTTTGQLAAATSGVLAAHNDVEAARARVSEAEANYNRVSTDLKRLTTLVQKDEVSRQEYDTAVSAERAAKASLDAARANVNVAVGREAQATAQAQSANTVPEQLRMTKARAGSASAQVDKARAALAQAQLNLQYVKIVAPVAGVLSKRSVEPGQVVQAGQPVFSIVGTDDIWVTANFKETQLKHMRVGQRAKVHLDSNGRDYNGTVESIGQATGARFSLLPPENASGNYVKVVQRVPVRIRIDRGQDPEHILRQGLSVEPTVFVK